MLDLKIHEAAQTNRNVGIGSTDARVIAEGKEWNRLWQEKTGRAPHENLTHVWKVQLGLTTEKLHAWWHAHTSGLKVWDPFEGNPVTSDRVPAHHYTSLDRIVGVADGFELLEMKHTHAGNDLRTAAIFYMAQLQWQMYVTGQPIIRFSIIRGNSEPEWGYVDRDDDYIAKLVAQAEAFWWHVTENEAPHTDEGLLVGNDMLAIAKTIKVDGLRNYDKTGDNEWAAASWNFLRDKVASEGLKESEKTIRALIPEDAAIISGHGVSFKRDARGAYRVTMDEDEVKAWRLRFDDLKGK